MDGRLAELINDFERSRGGTVRHRPSGFTLAELEPFALASPEQYPEYTAVAERLRADLAAAEASGELRRARDDHGAERLYVDLEWRRRAT